MTQEELFEHMREWKAFVRRHNANIFDVMFKDVDYSLKDDELCSIISDIALFFGLDIPIIKTHCDTLARIEFDSDNENSSELYYNWQLLQKSGINNKTHTDNLRSRLHIPEYHKRNHATTTVICGFPYV